MKIAKWQQLATFIICCYHQFFLLEGDDFVVLLTTLDVRLRSFSLTTRIESEN